MPMALVVDRLPFFERPTTLLAAREPVSVKADQIILWMSLGEDTRTEELPARPFPVVLDTGLSHNFAIREEQLIEWAGLYPPLLAVLGHARLGGRPANLLAAKAWIYRNQPGQRDALTDHRPFPLEMADGIAVYPRGAPDTPRLPALGLRALRLAGLQLHIDGERSRVSLWTRRRFWIFG